MNFLKKNKISLFVFCLFLVVGFLLLPQLVLAQTSLGLETGAGTGLGTRDLKDLLVSIVQILLGFLGLVAVALMIYGGFIWMTASGSAEKIDQGKRIVINVGIGLVIILISFAVVTFIANVIGDATGTSGPGTTINNNINTNNNTGGDLPGEEEEVSCFNNIQDGNETGIDCGGACGACAGESCSADVLTCVPDNNLCASGVCSESCLCQPSPIITQIDPDNGAIGNWITIFGRDFGDTPGQVTIGGTVAPLPSAGQCDSSWQDNQIIVEVPDISLGNQSLVITTAQGLISKSVDFLVNEIIRPGICQIEPESGAYQSSFTVNGIQFGEATDTRNIYFGSPDNPFNALNPSWGSQSVSAEVPNLVAGESGVRVEVNGVSSNALAFIVEESLAPEVVISYFTPTGGGIGQYINIYGEGFGDYVAGESQVKFATDRLGSFDFPEACGTVFWSDNQIVVKVPDPEVVGGLDASGPLMVITASGQTAVSADDFDFNIEALVSPGICSLNPREGQAGSVIEVAGEGFTDSTLYLGDQILSSTPDSNNLYSAVSIPVGSVSGPVKVIREDLESNSFDFAVLEIPSEAGSISGYYQWQFTTCQDCIVPEVVESNSCEIGLASPAPLRNSQDNFTDTLISAAFTVNMEESDLVLGETVKLFSCGNGTAPADCQSLSLTPADGELIFYPAVDSSQSYFVVDLNNNLNVNTWYQVVLSQSLRSHLEDENGLVERIAMAEDYGDGAYGFSGDGWYFKTRVDDLACVGNQVKVFPANRTNANGNPVLIGSTVNYSSQLLNSESCQLCPAEYSWDWTSSDQANAVIAESVVSTTTLQAFGVTEQAVTILAQATDAPDTPVGNALVDIIYPSPKVVIQNQCAVDPPASPVPYPNSQDACINAIPTFKFDRLMDPATLISDNISLFRCQDGSCSFPVVVTLDLISGTIDGGSGIIGVKISPEDNLLTNTNYQIRLSNNITSDKGRNLTGISKWNFKTRDSNEPCVFTTVTVTPDKFTFTEPDSFKEYTSLPTGQDCQILKPINDISWNWFSTDESVAVASITTDIVNNVSVGNKEGTAIIRASSLGVVNQDDNGLLLVDFSGNSIDILNLINYAPSTSTPACLNTLGRLEFSIPLKETTATSTNIQVLKIEDTSTTTIPVDININLSTDKKIIDFYPDSTIGLWASSTDYLIKFSGGQFGLKSFSGALFNEESCTNLGLNWDTEEEICSWNFTTSDQTCAVSYMEVEPSAATTTVGMPENWQATPYDSNNSPLSDVITSWLVQTVYSPSGEVVADVTAASDGRSAVSQALNVGQVNIIAGLSVNGQMIDGSASLQVNELPVGPQVSDVEPSGDNVCRNVLVNVELDKRLDLASVNSQTVSVEYYNEEEADGCRLAKNSDQSLIKPTFLSTSWLTQAFNWISANLFNKIFSSVKAQSYLCSVNGTWTTENSLYGSSLSFAPSQALPAATPIRLQLSGGEDGIKAENGLPLIGNNLDEQGDFVHQFTTASSICRISFVNVLADEKNNLNSWTFSTSFDNTVDNDPQNAVNFDTINDRDKKYTAAAYSFEGQQLTPISGVYEWDWQWQSSDSLVADISQLQNDFAIISAENNNGIAQINAIAEVVSLSEEVSGSAIAKVDLCENPWPARVSEQPSEFIDSDFNFALSYCLDYGRYGFNDDLPAINEDEMVINEFDLNDPGADELIKEYLISVPLTGDLIGIRIYENSFHLSPEDWYEKNIAFKGDASSLEVDGYPAIRDGRTVYVAATDADINPNNSISRAFSDVFLISYNQNASEQTVAIVKRLLGNWRFNTNVIKESLKQKLTRDSIRLSDMASVSNSLQNYYSTSGQYPSLSAGSFIFGMSASKWPSWNQTLGSALGQSLPSDPSNNFSSCIACQEPELDNADFEDSSLGSWKITYGVETDLNTNSQFIKEGDQSLRILASGGSQGIGQSLNLIANTTYEMFAWVYVLSGRVHLTFIGDDYGNEWVSPEGFTGWLKLENRLITNDNSSSGSNSPVNSLYISSFEGPAEFYVDDVVLQTAGGNCGYDPDTCWNPEANNFKGAFACGPNSYFYLYQSIVNTSGEYTDYNLTARLEATSNWQPANTGLYSYINSHVNLSTDALPICDSGTVAGFCGNGLVELGEECEGGQLYYLCDPKLHNWNNQSAIGPYGCLEAGLTDECSWYTPLTGSMSAEEYCGGWCGDGVLNTAAAGYNVGPAGNEQCDSSAPSYADGFGGGTSISDQYACTSCGDSGGWCGDELVQSSYGEECDGSVSNGVCSNCQISCNANYHLENNQCVINSPVVPANLRSVSRSATLINLSWSASSLADYYQLIRKTGTSCSTSSGYIKIGSNLSGTSYSNTGLSSNTNYCYKVRACNEGGCSSYSSPVSVSTLLSTPATPTITNITPNSMTINWSAISGAHHYNLYRSVDNPGNFSLLTEDITGTSYTNTGLSGNTTYFYKVTACDISENNCSILSSYGSGRTLDNPPAITFFEVNPTVVASGGSVTLSWGSQNTDRCSLVASDPIAINLPSSGNYTLNNITENFQVFLICLSDNDQVTSSVNVVVNQEITKIFLSQTYRINTDFSSLAEADSLCQSEASGNSLLGTWQAWLSDENQSAISRLNLPSSNSYQLLNGTVIANSLSQFTSDDHLVDINVGANSNIINAYPYRVWTGTLPSGNYSGLSCFNWQFSSYGTNATIGNYGASTSGDWTNSSGGGDCRTSNRFYCINTGGNAGTDIQNNKQDAGSQGNN